MSKAVERYFQFSLLGLVSSGFFALAGTGKLDLPTIVLTSLALLLRAVVLAGWVKFEVPPRAVFALAVCYIAFYPLDFYWLSRDFFIATVHGVCFLAAVKILTGKTDRDLLYTGVVAFIELVGAALLSWQASFFIWMALYLLFAVAAFTSAEIRHAAARGGTVVSGGRSLPWRLAGVAISALLGILFVTAGLFLIVPRTARAAAVLFPGASRLTGFSNVIDLGTFGSISKDDRVVMHVLSYNRPLPVNLKWRGATLSRFDGRRWFEPTPLLPPTVPINNGIAEVAGRLQRSRLDGRRLLYRVDSTASDNGVLFIAGIPEYLNLSAPKLIRRPGDVFQALPPTNESLRYEVSSLLAQPLPEPLTDRDRSRYLALPPLDSRIYALAREWSGEGPAVDRALRIQDHLRRDYKYVLESSSGRGIDPLPNFLFNTKRGYCEYFASAMAVMLRATGTPARVVTGFQSGYYNRVSGMSVIRASDAHAWVEGWIPDRGWLTFDPTPSSSGLENGLMGRINMYLDAADSVWQQWVMAYDLSRQATLAVRIESAIRQFRKPAAPTPSKPFDWSWLAPLGAALLALWYLPRGVRWLRNRVWLNRVAKGAGSQSDAGRLYQLMLQKAGLALPAGVTPQEFATGAEPRVAGFTTLYNEARYGGSTQAMSRMAEMLKEWN